MSDLVARHLYALPLMGVVFGGDLSYGWSPFFALAACCLAHLVARAADGSVRIAILLGNQLFFFLAFVLSSVLISASGLTLGFHCQVVTNA